MSLDRCLQIEARDRHLTGIDRQFGLDGDRLTLLVGMGGLNGVAGDIAKPIEPIAGHRHQ